MPEDGSYGEICGSMWPNLYRAGFTPILYAADQRVKLDVKIELRSMAEADELEDFEDRHVKIRNIPSSFQEAINLLREGRHDLEVTSPPSSRIKRIADQIYREEKQWQKNYASLVSCCLKKHKRVYVVAGLAHIITLHIKTGWPFQYLGHQDLEYTPEFFYDTGISLTAIHDAIRRM